MFKNRVEAGIKLAKKLSQYKHTDSVVLALPRGGVVIGFEVAKALHLPLDVVVTRKIGHPTSEEFAVCAVNAEGDIFCNEGTMTGIEKKWLKRRQNEEREEAQRRIKKYRGLRPPLNFKNKTVIVVDDGVATGLTVQLAIQSIKKQKPFRIVLAVPVISEEAARSLIHEVDELIFLESPRSFLGAVGAHYIDFKQTTDEEVVDLLNKNPLM